jgi:hypothetical protein
MQDSSKGAGERARLRRESHEVTGDSGAIYQVETEVFWDDKAHETIRVFASIDDGGRPAFMPMTAAFILAPDGGFVGE